jgi:hypothetical protein
LDLPVFFEQRRIQINTMAAFPRRHAHLAHW